MPPLLAWGNAMANLPHEFPLAALRWLAQSGSYAIPNITQPVFVRGMSPMHAVKIQGL
jgi:hypothetical protein